MAPHGVLENNLGHFINEHKKNIRSSAMAQTNDDFRFRIISLSRLVVIQKNGKSFKNALDNTPAISEPNLKEIKKEFYNKTKQTLKQTQKNTLLSLSFYV